MGFLVTFPTNSLAQAQAMLLRPTVALPGGRADPRVAPRPAEAGCAERGLGIIAPPVGGRSPDGDQVDHNATTEVQRRCDISGSLRSVQVVLVHGNPATTQVWDYAVDHLEAAGHSAVRLSPPGFGAPVPADFKAGMLDYRDWLVQELTGFEETVHLAGHDWGGAHVINVAMMRPDLLRSWCSNTIGLFNPDYEWHDHAKIWQSFGEREAW